MLRTASLLGILPCALVALALLLSAAAWGAHSFSHDLDQAAAAGEHAADHKHAPDHDRQDGGHDHFQGLSFQVAALFGGADLTPPPAPAAAPPAARVPTLALRPVDPPLPDPPRTA